MKPSDSQTSLFPVTVFLDDGQSWQFDNIGEMVITLEWFDSDTNESTRAIDKTGRPLRLKVEKLRLVALDVCNNE